MGEAPFSSPLPISDRLQPAFSGLRVLSCYGFVADGYGALSRQAAAAASESAPGECRSRIEYQYRKPKTASTNVR